MIKKLRKTDGFTIVELLIATTVLTVVLVGASFVLVQVGRLYYKGTITAKTQAAGRNIVDSISRPIQLRGSGVRKEPVGPVNVLCVGNQRFTYQTQAQVGTGGSRRPHAVWRDTIDNLDFCDDDVPDILNTSITLTGGESMLSDGMRLFDLDVEEVTDATGTGKGIYVVTVRIGYGDDVFTTDPVSGIEDGCLSQIAGGQFCAFAVYETTVNARIRQ